MNKEFEKILKKTKEKCKQSYITNHGKDYTEFDICTELSLCFNEVQRIVQEVVEEYNGGWIPCSERLPEEAFGCLVTVMDCEPSTQTDFENILPYFVGYDGETWNDADGKEIPFEVIAWMPLPKPHKESD